MEAVCDAAATKGIEAVTAGLDELFEAGIKPVDSADAVVWIRSLEHLGRRVEAAKVELLAAIDAGRLHAGDGHFSAKKMVEHIGVISSSEATARDRTRRMLADLTDVARVFAAAGVSSDHARLLGRIHANPRVRPLMNDAQDWFLDRARSLSFRDFEQVVREWERLADADGARDRNQANHEKRNATMVHDSFDLSWELRGRWASLTGAELGEIVAAYADAEYEADWEKARAEHGDAATAAHLPRTAAQRRADALAQILRDAANSGSTIATPPVHNIVWSADSYEAMLAALEAGSCPNLDVDSHRCSTLDGVPVDPTETVVASLVSAARRVVVDAAGVVIDLGRTRLFSGSARHAALLNSPNCIWPGCHKPASRCEVDHLTEHSRGGRTNPGNGAPLCGRHNRHKQNARFGVRRDRNGEYIVTRPDGTAV